jgi:hypothetical protein
MQEFVKYHEGIFRKITCNDRCLFRNTNIGHVDRNSEQSHVMKRMVYSKKTSVSNLFCLSVQICKWTWTTQPNKLIVVVKKGMENMHPSNIKK